MLSLGISLFVCAITGVHGAPPRFSSRLIIGPRGSVPPIELLAVLASMTAGGLLLIAGTVNFWPVVQ